MGRMKLFPATFRRRFIERRDKEYWLLLAIFPVLFVSVINPSSFGLVWNQGRGGFIFAAIFLMIEYFDARHQLRLILRGKRMVLVLSSLVFSLAYFSSIELGPLQTRILELGEFLNIQLSSSFLWLWDYLVLLLYLAVVISASYGWKSLRKMPSCMVYIAGFIIILALDALFPFESLGPLQAIVPVLLSIDVFLIHLFGIGEAIVVGNYITLTGNHGPFTLAVFWPSAGVHSMIIYSLIMSIFLLKLDIRFPKKITYFVAGAIGTFMVNAFRIFLLSTYVMLVSTDSRSFESFHAVAGELLFLPWLAIFLFAVTFIETRKTRLDIPKKALQTTTKGTQYER